jgi:hypothetical protein
LLETACHPDGEHVEEVQDHLLRIVFGHLVPFGLRRQRSGSTWTRLAQVLGSPGTWREPTVRKDVRESIRQEMRRD